MPEFDRHELRIYEEVAKVPPFRRKTLVLIGAQGVGRRSLKNKILVSDSHRYGTTTPCQCIFIFNICALNIKIGFMLDVFKVGPHLLLLLYNIILL